VSDDPRSRSKLSQTNTVLAESRVLKLLTVVDDCFQVDSPHGHVRGSPENAPGECRPDLNLILDSLLSETGADAAELFLAAPISGQLQLAAHRGPASRAFRQMLEFERGQGFPGLVAQSQSPLVCLDLANDRRYLRSEVTRRGFQQYVCVPLNGSSGCLGSLHVAFRRRLGMPADTLPILEGVARHLAVTLEMLRWRAAAQVTFSVLTTYREGAASFQEAARRGLEALIGLARVDCGALLMSDGEAGRLRLGHEVDLPLHLHRAFVRTRACVGCPAVARQRTVLPTDPDRGGSPLCQVVHRDLSTTLCLPLIVHGQAFGVVLLGSPGTQHMPGQLLTRLDVAIDRVAKSLYETWDALARSTLASVRLAENDVSGRLDSDSLDLNGRTGLLLRTGPARPKSPSETTSESAWLDLRCLGSFQVFRQGLPIPPECFVRRRSLTLLKILLTRHGKQVHREELIDLLWSGAPPASANDLLNVVVHHLRRVLDSGLPDCARNSFVRTSGDFYAFNVDLPHRVDSVEFQQAVHEGTVSEARGDAAAALAAFDRAIRLYAGDFLEDEPFGDWCALEREYLRETFLTTLRRTACLYRDRGDADSAISCLQKALRIDPTQEEAHRSLMEIFWQTGRRDEALRQYRICRAALRRVLGIAPMPETEALRRRITTGV
jgi:DNA-binding SARP family transcriptional activator/GAF domain-containing protein